MKGHEMGFTVTTSYQGLFVVTEQSVRRFDQKGESESCGFLVRKHYDEVRKTLQVANILKEGKVFESRAGYFPDPDDPPLEMLRRLVVCLDALERLLSQATDGEYESAVAVLNRQDASHTELNEHKYWGEIQDIYWHIKELREGKYHESDDLRYTGRRGIPKISTTGRRLVDKIMDMFWKMDGDFPNMWTYPY